MRTAVAADGAHYGYEGHGTYNKWLKIGHLHAPKTYIGKDLQDHYGGAAREVERDFDKIIAVMEKMKAADISDKIIKDNGLVDREAGYVKGLAAAWDHRLAQLKKDRAELIKFIGGGLGFP